MFFYLYKTSGKFRQSIIAAFMAATVYSSGLTPAHSAGEADAAFTQKNPQHQSRPESDRGIFGRKSNNDGSGGNELPQFPQPESVEGTQERVDRINEHLRRMKEVSDSDTESEEDQCRIDQQIQSEGVNNQNSGLTKARNNLTPVQDDKLTPEGDFVNPSKLTSKGRSIINKTKDRRSAPLLQSRCEDRDKEFLPAYSIQQIENKNKHTLEVLQKLGKNITKYNELPQDKQLQIDFAIVEGLLAHPDTELHMNVMGQGREPIAMILNRGLGNYSLKNHIGTFERRLEIFEYNPYISNYVATDA